MEWIEGNCDDGRCDCNEQTEKIMKMDGIPRFRIQQADSQRIIMSASARLHELDAALSSSYIGVKQDTLIELGRALPELAALAEAADPDTEGSAHWLCMGTVAMVDGSRQSCPICEALERLARKLGERG